MLNRFHAKRERFLSTFLNVNRNTIGFNSTTQKSQKENITHRCIFISCMRLKINR